MIRSSKIMPSKFNGDIEKIPLSVVTDYISSSSILSVKKDKDIGVLFFFNGKLINACVNGNFHINKAKDILKWKKRNL